ncbi:MAG TPA: plastocyanin/azurin family copper-binding protein [Gemmatimonadales bacterium]|nr:plastocyanin/azurin family copper-binding protein [Gemmatimonadales bacterium]
MTAPSRRGFLSAGAAALAGLGVAPLWEPSLYALVRPTGAPGTGVVTIRMRSDPAGSWVSFDPVGLFVEPGTTIRWVVQANVHTTTAYHPRNDHHPLRIPEAATPWDSGYLVNPGNHFEVTLTVPGVYDYFCTPHEAAGMVGRIVVGRAAGPGAEPFDYWAGRPGTADWRHVPDAARRTFPGVARILAERRVRPVRGG